MPVIFKYEIKTFIMPSKKTPGPQVKNPDQYEALKDRGYSKEKAARISNSKDAEKRGGKAKAYEDQTKQEIYEEAKKVGIQGRSKMTKKELMHALRTN